MTVCSAVIDLRSPVRSERVRAGFQPHWRTVYIYQCPACQTTRRIFASAFRGKNPEPGVGGVICGAVLAPDGQHYPMPRMEDAS